MFTAFANLGDNDTCGRLTRNSHDPARIVAFRDGTARVRRSPLRIGRAIQQLDLSAVLPGIGQLSVNRTVKQTDHFCPGEPLPCYQQDHASSVLDRV